MPIVLGYNPRKLTLCSLVMMWKCHLLVERAWMFGDDVIKNKHGSGEGRRGRTAETVRSRLNPTSIMSSAENDPFYLRLVTVFSPFFDKLTARLADTSKHPHFFGAPYVKNGYSSTGHSCKHGHEFLEFEYSHGRMRYANNSNYRNDSLIRKESRYQTALEIFSGLNAPSLL